MEYYAGVLLLTTNRVGVFDEAFTSRIHISLYYPPLERDPTHQIFVKNIERIKDRYRKNQKRIDIKESEISKFALDYFDENKQGRWNGRQIRNAFQTALALAELEAHGTDDVSNENDQEQLVTLRRSNFEVVAKAYKSFTEYLNQTYGVDSARRARENLWRSDTFGTPPRTSNPLTTRLKVEDPRQAPGQWSSHNYMSHNWNRGNQPHYPQPGAYPNPSGSQYQDTRLPHGQGFAQPYGPGEHFPGHIPGQMTYAPHSADRQGEPLPGAPSLWGGDGREPPRASHPMPPYPSQPAYGRDPGPSPAFPPDSGAK